MSGSCRDPGDVVTTMRTIGVAIAIPEPHGGDLQRYRESYGDPLAAAIPTHVTLLPPTPLHASDFSEVEEHLRKVAQIVVDAARIGVPLDDRDANGRHAWEPLRPALAEPPGVLETGLVHAGYLRRAR